MLNNEYIQFENNTIKLKPNDDGTHAVYSPAGLQMVPFDKLPNYVKDAVRTAQRGGE